MYRFFVTIGSVLLALCIEGRTQAGDFTLKVEAVEALEGGPVVLRVTLIYQGKEPVSVDSLCLQSGYVSVQTPTSWKKCRVGPGTIGWKRFVRTSTIGGGGLMIVNYQTMMRGDSFSVTSFVHRDFDRIPSGRASFRVIWKVDVRGKSGPIEVASPLVVDVQPATQENLAALRKRIEATLARPGLQATDKQEVSQCILGTEHPALLPPALRMIASGDDAYFLDSLIDFCYSLDNIPPDVHERFLDLVDNPAWRGRLTLFEDWEFRRVSLPRQQFRRLLESKNIWTRVLTAVTFPRQCDKAWTVALARDLHDLSQPLPSGQFARLLRDLDNDTFVVREKATAQLGIYGERAESQLQQALRTDLSPEAKRRVRLTLERIAAAKEKPEWKPILDYLSSGDCDRDAAVAILRALAKGTPDATLTKAAVASLKKLSAPGKGIEK
jgi:hypothetical protein